MAERDEVLLLIGTYTERMPHVDGRGEGIHLVRFDQAAGRFGAPIAVGGLRNPSYLTVSAAADRVYCVTEVAAGEGPTVEAFALDAAAMNLAPFESAPASGGWPCHLSLNEAARHLYVSNYESGNCAVFDLDEAGRPVHQALLQRSGTGPRADRQEAAHAHCAVASPDGRHLYLCDLGTDRIARHPIDAGRVADRHDIEIAAEPGAGPRHAVFTPSGRFLLSLHELASTLSLYRNEGGEAEEVATVSTLPAGWSGTNHTAAVRVGPDGRTVYASNRGHDSVFAARFDEDAASLAPLGHWPVDGRTPRDIALSPNGRFLLAASQDDDRLTVFAVDAGSGMLHDTAVRLAVRSPVCLCFGPAGASS